MALAATAEKRATGLFCMAAFLCSVGSAAIAPEKHLLSTTFQHFSDNLYCSGSEERLCGTGAPLCQKQPPRGFRRFALQHAPPAPDQAQGGLEPRPVAVDDCQICPGGPAMQALVAT